MSVTKTYIKIMNITYLKLFLQYSNTRQLLVETGAIITVWKLSIWWDW